ncbi:MAG: glycosyltransferase family 39 protein [Acidobacteria bacterium]|nr:glycosyltransferase family 39 protein [Acidobacteriota bacterium]
MSIVPYIGIQTDEALFSEALFDNPYAWFTLSVFKKKIPLMVMSYIGSAKTALYYLVFQAVAPTVWALRAPVVLLAAATIIVFYFFVLRATKASIAWFAAALIAFDSSYLLSSTLDWGPVAIQHVCLAAGLLLLVKFHQENNLRSLAGGFFAFGFGLWDKALFAWLLSALIIAGVAVFPQEIKRNLSRRCVIIATVFFLVGALPLVIYNIRRPLETFRGNASLSSDDLGVKANLLRVTLNGSVFFGFLVEEDWAVKQREPVSALEKASVSLDRAAGERREHLYWYAFVAALLAAPLLLFTCWRRPVLFCLIFLAVAWGQMLATKGAGGGAHHTILLWPIPLMLIAIAATALAERSGRWEQPLLGALAVLLCGSALLVTNHYLAQAIRNGAPGAWSTANFNLAVRLPAYSARRIFLTDWGMLDNTRMLQQGRLPLIQASEPLMRAEPSGDDRRNMKAMLEEPNAIFASNTDARQVFPEVNPRLTRIARELGYERELLEVIYDYNGRPCFEIFRFRVISPPAPPSRQSGPARAARPGRL